jgi:uncharacterized protein YgfB (UPF0149 family)
VNEFQSPDYLKLAQQFISHDLQASPAEIHGLMSGLLAGGMPQSDLSWQAHIHELFNNGAALPVALNSQLAALLESIYTALKDPDFSFNPLLPEDDAPLDERAEAMAQWVQNFVVGFALVCQELSKAPEDIQELLSDFNTISQLSMEFESAEDESNEQAYFEVLEYLRIGAMACFNHFCLREAQDSPTLH